MLLAINLEVVIEDITDVEIEYQRLIQKHQKVIDALAADQPAETITFDNVLKLLGESEEIKMHLNELILEKVMELNAAKEKTINDFLYSLKEKAKQAVYPGITEWIETKIDELKKAIQPKIGYSRFKQYGYDWSDYKYEDKKDKKKNKQSAWDWEEQTPSRQKKNTWREEGEDEPYFNSY